MSKATVRDIECLHETDAAIRVTDHAGFEEWIPKSQVHDDSEVWEQDQVGDLVLKLWIANKLGLDPD